MNLTAITTAATKQLVAGRTPTDLFGAQHKYDAPKFIEGCMCYAVACALVSSSSTSSALDVYVNALRAIRDFSGERKRYDTAMERTASALLRNEDERVRRASQLVAERLLPPTTTGHHQHPLRSFYSQRGFHVLVVSSEQVSSQSSALLGTPVRREELDSCVNMEEMYGSRVAVLEAGSEVPLLVFVSGMLRSESLKGEEKKETEAEAEVEETKMIQRSPPPADRASALEALKLGTSRLSCWHEHAAPPMMHTGYTTPLVRSFAFAFKSDSQHDPSNGLCELHGLPVVRERSTLVQNRSILRDEFAPLVRWLDSSYSENMNRSVIRRMESLMERCDGRWAVVPGTKFTALGVHLNFAQHYHVDEADVDDSLSVVVYDVMNPDNHDGGELVFPGLEMYLRPRQGDVLYWRTKRVIHGVAPFVENTSLRRASWVLFQTEDCSKGCLECSED
jgi:hypothetical protein